MADFEKNIPPKIYHTNDTDGIIELWKNLVGETFDDERVFAESFQEIIDPDTAPMDFVEIMLKQLGNPFNSLFLSDTQKRKLVKLLIPIYQQKGTAKGIVNAVRFLLGIEVEIIDPHADEENGWQVGRSEVGLSTYVGGRRVYSNMLDYTEEFDNIVWLKTSASVVADAASGPPPWGRPSDELDMSATGAQISQTATPVRISGETFTGSIYLQASSAASLTAIIRSVSNPTDSTSTTLNVTTSGQRFEFQHTMSGGATGDVEFVLYSASGFAPTLYAFGAQLVRSDENQPYARRTNDGEDSNEVGAWAYHFFIQSPVSLTANQEAIIGIIADFMKTAHTHYTILAPGDYGFVDHWEVGLSRVGINTFVHA